MTREEALNQAVKVFGEEVARAELVHRARAHQARLRLQEELHRAEGDFFMALDQARADLLEATRQAGAVLPEGLVQEKEEGK